MPALITDEELLALLRGSEGSRVEFKRAAHRDDVKQAVVAFANTIREADRGVLFIGVKDDATIIGVPNSDAVQKDLRVCIEECYPPIEGWEIRNLMAKDQTVLAIIVPESRTSPHFAGPAFVRQGSESVKASATMYQQLLADHVSPARRLRPWLGKQISVETEGIDAAFRTGWLGGSKMRMLVRVDEIGLVLDVGGEPLRADWGRVILQPDIPGQPPRVRIAN